MAFGVLFVGVPLNLYVTIRLWRLSRQAPDTRVLRERAIVSLAVLLLIAVFGLIFLNNDLDAPVLSFDDTKLYTRLAMLALALFPATYWLWLYREDGSHR
jgi:hypothetical protein